MNKKVEPIETKRLILREIQEEDTPWIVQWRSDPNVYQYFFFPKPITEEEHLNWYQKSYKKDKNRIDFMAIEKESEKRMGVFHIKRNIEDLRFSEMGYLLDESAQGKGYAQEGVKRLMLLAGEIWGCKEAILYIHEKNKASQALAEKLGYEERARKGNFLVYYADLTSSFKGI